MNWLSGKKAYLAAAGLALATFARAMGWLDDGPYQVLMGLLGAGGLAALRAGVAKSTPPGPGNSPAWTPGGRE